MTMFPEWMTENGEAVMADWKTVQEQGKQLKADPHCFDDSLSALTEEFLDRVAKVDDTCALHLLDRMSIPERILTWRLFRIRHSKERLKEYMTNCKAQVNPRIKDLAPYLIDWSKYAPMED